MDELKAALKTDVYLTVLRKLKKLNYAQYRYKDARRMLILADCGGSKYAIKNNL